MAIEIRTIKYGTNEYEESIDLRNELFRKPWGLDIRDEDLSQDENMLMFGAYDGDTLIGTIFLAHGEKNIGIIKSVTVDKKYQGTGLGRYLMNYIEDVAREKGYKEAKLMGRVSVQVFYEKLGYKVISEPYDYKTIPHVDMIKKL